uniref:Uncharacterized protein n=1 Tax=Rhizophora mucronata TaxID=61149 RepID=A0A2P2PMV7_RHIMU
MQFGKSHAYTDNMIREVTYRSHIYVIAISIWLFTDWRIKT